LKTFLNTDAVRHSDYVSGTRWRSRRSKFPNFCCARCAATVLC